MKNNKKIVILGDSLGMPRPKENITYEDTYVSFLKRELNGFEVIDRHRRSNDTKRQLENINDDVIDILPDIVIIHLGIVDCTPRLFSRKQERLLSILPGRIRFVIINFFSTYRNIFTRIFPKVYVTSNEYDKNINKIISSVKNINAIPVLITILDTNEINKKRTHNYEKNISEYNKILRNISNQQGVPLVNFSKYNLSDLILNDGHHLSIYGNMVLGQELKKLIKKIM